VSTLAGILRSPVPPAHRTELALGWLALLLFLMQVSTGILLSLYYQPAPTVVRESVEVIMRDVGSGWLVRGLHHWGSHALIVFLLARLTYMLLRGSYRGAGSTSWHLGLLLLWLLVAAAFSGELLPWDNEAFWRMDSLLARVESLPWVGPTWAAILRGGEEISATTLARTYSLHSMFVPWLIWLLLALNLWFLARRIHSSSAGGPR
jgi:quinol-cytochrome oxidoreductase complex cytochrome b subunit